MTSDVEELNNLISICSANIKNSKETLDYLESRGLTQDYIEKYKIGFFPQNTRKLFEYVNENTLIRLNIAHPGYQSKFSQYFSLVFPIFNEYGEPQGINGRTILNDYDREVLSIAKYENSKYKKSNILYGLNHSRSSILKSNNVYVVEGNFDQISMDIHGIKNSVAICGTAFSNNHFVKLLRYTDTITFLLDGDDAGKKSMGSIFHKFSGKGANLYFKSLPEKYKDIDQYFYEGNTKEDLVEALEDCLVEW